MRPSSPSTRAALRERPTARDRWRRPLAGGVIVSVAAHAALLAWAVIEVPDPPDDRRSIERRAPVTAPPREDEPVLRVVQIRPPGVLPSGGGARAPAEPRADAGPSAAPIAPAAPAPRRALPKAPPTVVPSDEARPIPIAAAIDPEDEEREAGTAAPGRPNRGIVLRRGGGSESSGSREGVRGVGVGAAGGSGVTIVGRGGDCITPGIAVPAGGAPRGGWLPDRRAGAGGLRTGGGLGRGRPGGP